MSKISGDINSAMLRITQGDGKRIAELEDELERERMRLAACGCVALANTPESAAKAREMLPEYRSASCDDVARIVDSEMALRKERDELKANMMRLRLAIIVTCCDPYGKVCFGGSDGDREILQLALDETSLT